jgi:hypothetical protein
MKINQTLANLICSNKQSIDEFTNKMVNGEYDAINFNNFYEKKANYEALSLLSDRLSLCLDDTNISKLRNNYINDLITMSGSIANKSTSASTNIMRDYELQALSYICANWNFLTNQN